MKAPASTCQVDDLIATIRRYQLYNSLQSDHRSEPNIVLSGIRLCKLGV